MSLYKMREVLKLNKLRILPKILKNKLTISNFSLKSENLTQNIHLVHKPIVFHMDSVFFTNSLFRLSSQNLILHLNFHNLVIRLRFHAEHPH
ncbi:unnamed protein product [Moneuplotes crassus]|uniref:Uncharacterized protein n=1 Tax=Euplotes crassus TaxID=5936 RepID=A0AAD1XE18_EUPCR|nr:unnamed protein product [Moneuplotes crassus]